MNFRKELANSIEAKYIGAIKNLMSEGVDPSLIKGRGCVAFACDGFLRGDLTQDDYENHLRQQVEGKIFPREWVLEMVLEISGVFEDVPEERSTISFYSSSPKATGRSDLIPQPMSKGKALELARDIRVGRTLSVFIDTEVKGYGHLLCLTGDNGAILRVDGATQAIVNCLSNREAAKLMRRGQRQGGLVVDIR